MKKFVANITQMDNLMTTISYAIFVVMATFVFFLFFCYAKKRNLRLYTLLVALVIFVLFGVAFLTSASELTFYVYFALVVLCVMSIVLFTQDINRNIFRTSGGRKLNKDGSPAQYGSEDLTKSTNEIIKACLRMSKTDTGALIVFADNISDEILDSGIRVNAEITAELLETMFFPKTPLHDGAVIITGNRVVAAGCYLPLTQAQNLPREFGTRHRAAIGVSGAFPGVTAIVVSEETGIISAVHDNKVKRYLDAKLLQSILECALGLADESAEDKIWGENR
ncbi:MAG: DNA integrity scanning protein DisA nucleotide-binding domain protein [Clostridiales bacterium]|nr:DNA integrity scanning protein DisA nucleotide-binding domain protein [Clostridiales bacterium]